MLEENKYYVDDVGTTILVDVGSDVSEATECLLYVRKPNGTVVTWIAAVSGAEEISYVVQDGDWDLAGIYMLQAYVVTPAWSGRGSTATFTVYTDFK